MTDFNTETNIEATAAETTTEAKATKEITTAKHARFLAEAARKRAEKFRTQATAADESPPSTTNWPRPCPSPTHPAVAARCAL